MAKPGEVRESLTLSGRFMREELRLWARWGRVRSIPWNLAGQGRSRVANNDSRRLIDRLAPVKLPTEDMGPPGGRYEIFGVPIIGSLELLYGVLIDFQRSCKYF
jgi:hypothetical protein